MVTTLLFNFSNNDRIELINFMKYFKLIKINANMS